MKQKYWLFLESGEDWFVIDDKELDIYLGIVE